jgi:hypothetical protein
MEYIAVCTVCDVHVLHSTKDNCMLPTVCAIYVNSMEHVPYCLYRLYVLCMYRTAYTVYTYCACTVLPIPSIRTVHVPYSLLYMYRTAYTVYTYCTCTVLPIPSIRTVHVPYTRTAVNLSPHLCGQHIDHRGPQVALGAARVNASQHNCPEVEEESVRWRKRV